MEPLWWCHLNTSESNERCRLWQQVKTWEAVSYKPGDLHQSPSCYFDGYSFLARWLVVYNLLSRKESYFLASRKSWGDCISLHHETTAVNAKGRNWKMKTGLSVFLTQYQLSQNEHIHRLRGLKAFTVTIIHVTSKQWLPQFPGCLFLFIYGTLHIFNAILTQYYSCHFWTFW